MQEPTLVINHSADLSVTLYATNQVIGRHMQELTLVLNHSAALSVSTSAQHQVL